MFRVLLFTFAIILTANFSPAFSKDVIAKYGLNTDRYLKDHKRYTAKRYNLVHINGYNVNGKVYFATIWTAKATPAWKVEHNINRTALDSRNEKLKKDGYVLERLNGYKTKSETLYTVLWKKKPKAKVKALISLDQKKFQEEWKRLRNEGYTITNISSHDEQGKLVFNAIFNHNKKIEQTVEFGLTEESHIKKSKELSKQGLQPVAISATNIKGKNVYSSIWQKDLKKHYLTSHRLNSINYKSSIFNNKYTGYKLKTVSGYAIGKRAYFAATWEEGAIEHEALVKIDKEINAFLEKYRIPGLSIAIARKGKLVFAKGYGVSRIRPKWYASPVHRFRIASISKPITSLAILKLAEEGKLKLDDHVFGKGAILGERKGAVSNPASYPDEIKKITIKDLLQHTAGGDAWSNGNNTKTPDPAFEKPELDTDKLISWIIENKKVKSKPGEKYAYSNFGYHILGKVIEKKSGLPYDKYVKKNILRPAGIKKMLIAGNTRNKRKQGEVVYYGSNGEDPYNFDMKRMGPHGGWIASSIDLVRLMVHADGYNTRKDIITADMIKNMTTGSTANKEYALGWSVNKSGNWWHHGSLPGTYATLMRTKDGYCWAILTNARSNNPDFKKEFDNLAPKIIAAIKNWPDHDFF